MRNVESPARLLKYSTVDRSGLGHNAALHELECVDMRGGSVVVLLEKVTAQL